jgi:uncharacterized integral membrane protein (TIGR00698 family)
MSQMLSQTENIQSNFRGFILCAGIAVLATLTQNIPLWPFTLANGTHPFEAIIIAMVFGLLIGNVWSVATSFQPGIQFSAKRLLNLAIILLGARLNLAAMMHLPSRVLMIIVLCTTSVFFVSLLFARFVRLQSSMSILIAIGSAICGSAAIAAAAPVIHADKDDIAVAITSINLLGLLAIFLFPLLGHFLHVSQTHFGIWVGASIQAVPQVVASGFAYGRVAGTVGTLVKLVRVLLLAPFILGLSLWASKHLKGIEHHAPKRWQTYLPPFVVLFFVVIIVNSLGWLSPTMISIAREGSNFLMAMALAAIGLNTRVKSLVTSGGKAVLVATFGAIVIATLSYVALLV